MPNLVMLIGLPGSGKSSYAKENYPSYTYLSSDKIREELYGDASIQDNPQKVFQIMRERAIEALEDGKNVVYDATNLVRKRRADFIRSLPNGHLVTAAVIWAPLEECIKRDSERDRVVGKNVIMNMVKTFDAPWYDEGFTSIYYYNPANENDKRKYTNDIVSAMEGISHDNPHHSATISAHCYNCGKYLNEKGANIDIEWAGWLHDVGKPICKSFVNSKGEKSENAHYYGHQHVSAWLAAGAMGYSSFGVWLISNHMEPFFNSKYFKGMSKYLKDSLLILHEADLQAH